MTTSPASTVRDVAAEFSAAGVVRLDGAFTADEASAIQEVVWRYAERKIGIRRDDRTTWPYGWLPISWKGLKRNPVFEPLTNNGSVLQTLDTVFGAGGWERPKPGAQILLTLPAEEPWTLPDEWHMDCGFERPTWPVFAVKLFAFFDQVDPMGGGTMLLPGSHRLVERYRETLPDRTGGGKTNWRPFIKHDPWLAQLLKGTNLADGGRSFVGQRHEIDGIPVEVVELTGRPGDVVVTHLHVFHTASPNTTDRPRQMLGKAVQARPEVV